MNCKWCRLRIVRTEDGWVHAEGWTNNGYTHAAGQAVCEPDMQSMVATPNSIEDLERELEAAKEIAKACRDSSDCVGFASDLSPEATALLDRWSEEWWPK